jgi:hypothetical protein
VVAAAAAVAAVVVVCRNLSIAADNRIVAKEKEVNLVRVSWPLARWKVTIGSEDDVVSTADQGCS